MTFLKVKYIYNITVHGPLLCLMSNQTRSWQCGAY